MPPVPSPKNLIGRSTHSLQYCRHYAICGAGAPRRSGYPPAEARSIGLYLIFQIPPQTKNEFMPCMHHAVQAAVRAILQCQHKRLHTVNELLATQTLPYTPQEGDASTFFGFQKYRLFFPRRFAKEGSDWHTQRVSNSIQRTDRGRSLASFNGTKSIGRETTHRRQIARRDSPLIRCVTFFLNICDLLH